MRIANTKTPIAFLPDNTIALHLACRYPFAQMELRLQGNGANANAVDIKGQAPLHEVLKQTSQGREDDVVET